MNINDLAWEFFIADSENRSTDLVTDTESSISVSDAYQIQKQHINQKAQHNKEEIIGYKISMTSEKMQRLVGKSNEPAYGTLTTKNLIREKINLESDSPLLLEPELVFVLQDDLSFDADYNEIIEKSKIAAGFEIPSSRYSNWYPFNKDVRLVDIIADNAFTGFIQLGEITEIPRQMDWKNIKAKLYRDNIKVAEGFSKEVLGNPLNAVMWLIKKLRTQRLPLTKGMLISSGTFIDPMKLEQGEYSVEFDSIGELTLTVD